MKTYANVNGQQVDMSGVTGNRNFREAWSGVDSENVVTYDLATVKTVAKGKINEWRDEQKVKPFSSAKGTFDADAESKGNIDGVSQAALMATVTGAEFSQEWPDVDGTMVTFTAQEFMGLGMAILAHISSYYVEARTYKELVDEAVDMDAVLAVLSTLDA